MEAHFRVIREMGFVPVTAEGPQFSVRVRPHDGVCNLAKYEKPIGLALAQSFKLSSAFPPGADVKCVSVCPTFAFGTTAMVQAYSGALVSFSYPEGFVVQRLPRHVLFPNGLLAHPSHHPQGRVLPLYQWCSAHYYLNGKPAGSYFYVEPERPPADAPSNSQYHRELRILQVQKSQMNAKMAAPKKPCRGRTPDQRAASRERAERAASERSPPRERGGRAERDGRTSRSPTRSRSPSEDRRIRAGAGSSSAADAAMPPPPPPPPQAPQAVQAEAAATPVVAAGEAAAAPAQPLAMANQFAALAQGDAAPAHSPAPELAAAPAPAPALLAAHAAVQPDAGGAPEHASAGLEMEDGELADGQFGPDQFGPVMLTDEELADFNPDHEPFEGDAI